MTRVLRVPRGVRAGDRSLLDIAQGKGPSAERSRAGSKAKRAGQSFEDLIERAFECDATVCLSRGHPATKVVSDGRGGKRVIYAKKNGVDFVGTIHGVPVAFEAKRLPGAASLAGTKDGSTRAEASFLDQFHAAGGLAGFLCYDPDREVLAWVRGAHCESLAMGGRVLLRTPSGLAQVPTWGHAGQRVNDTLVRDVLHMLAAGHLAAREFTAREGGAP